MKLLIHIIWKLAVIVSGKASRLCDWCSDYDLEHYWYEECAKSQGRILWRAHDDFWIGRPPVFWD